MTETFEILIVIGLSLGLAWYFVRQLSTGVFMRRPPLHKAAASGGTIPIRRLLKRKSINIEGKALKNRSTALHVASWAGRVRAIQLLIDNGANINSRTIDGYTPLHSAILEDHAEAAKCLVENNADVHAKDDMGMTPLELAELLETDKSINYLQSVSSADYQTYKGNPNFDPGRHNIHWTVIHGSVRALKIALTTMRSKINDRDREGRTPLHLSAIYGYKRKTKFLIKAGADPHLYDQAGLLPLHYANRKEFNQIARILKKYGYPK